MQLAEASFATEKRGLFCKSFNVCCVIYSDKLIWDPLGLKRWLRMSRKIYLMGCRNHWYKRILKSFGKNQINAVETSDNMVLNDTHRLKLNTVEIYDKHLEGIYIYRTAVMSKYGQTGTCATSAASEHKRNEEKCCDTRKGNCGLRYLKCNYK